MRVKRYFAAHLISSVCSAVKFYCSALHSIYAGLWAEVFLIKLEYPAVFSALCRSYANLWAEVFLEKLEYPAVFSALCRSYANLWAEVFLIKLEFPAVFSALYRSYAGLWADTTLAPGRLSLRRVFLLCICFCCIRLLGFRTP